MQIGPTFAHELTVAGLAGLPISWTADGAIIGRDSLSAEQQEALDAVVAAHDPVAGELQAEKRDAICFVDSTAEAARGQFVTPGSAQAMVYQRKAEEARALRAEVADSGTPSAADYPHLSAEIGITAATLDGVADVILAKEAEWRQASAQIEGVRLAAKKAITAAPDAAAVQAVLDSLTWPTPEAATSS